MNGRTVMMKLQLETIPEDTQVYAITTKIGSMSKKKYNNYISIQCNMYYARNVTVVYHCCVDTDCIVYVMQY